MSTAAQDVDPTPTPVAEEATATPQPAQGDALAAAFLTLNLSAGNPLDPLVFSMNGGGPIDAATLDPGCSGYIPAAPSLTLNWSGEVDFVEAFFYSDHDPTLVVQLPDGSYLCNDDVNELLLDPLVELSDPPPGRYNLWVGSYHEDQLLPGFLVITANPAVSVSNFSLQGLVTRSKVPEIVARPAGSIPVERLSTLSRTLRAVPPIATTAEDLVVDVVAEGSVPAFELDHPGPRCAGFIRDMPADYTFQWHDDSESIRIFFEGDADATLVVTQPDGTVYCNDDTEAAVNLNPMVEIPNPAGEYFVYVGRLQLDEVVRGRLTITAAAEATPAVLSPATQPE
jgi:hypothetical protein